MPRKPAKPGVEADYTDLLARVSTVLEQGRRSAARTVNAVLAASYWQVGRHIVEHEQGGRRKAGYGEELLKRLTADLVARFGRGFSRRNLEQMRAFYLGWQICQTPSGKSQVRVRCELPDAAAAGKAQTLSAELTPAPALVPVVSLDTAAGLLDAFPLPWSHYVRLMAVRDDFARWFYEDEAIKGGWSVRQLDRQISTLLFERTGAAKNKAAVLAHGRAADPADAVTPVEAIRDPYLLEFLDLKDEYAEADLEEAIVRHLEAFLLELGTGFTFVARQKRVRVGDSWYKIDLLLFHRVLRCLVVIDRLCGSPHKRSCVAEWVMWRRTVRRPVPSRDARPERHITLPATGTAGTPSARRPPSTGRPPAGPRPRSWPAPWPSSPGPPRRTRWSSPATRARATPGSC